MELDSEEIAENLQKMSRFQFRRQLGSANCRRSRLSAHTMPIAPAAGQRSRSNTGTGPRGLGCLLPPDQEQEDSVAHPGPHPGQPKM